MYAEPPSAAGQFPALQNRLLNYMCSGLEMFAGAKFLQEV